MNEYVNVLKEANFDIVLVTNSVIRFHAHFDDGWRAFAIAIQRQWPIRSIHRIWPIINNEPTGPYWELKFYI